MGTWKNPAQKLKTKTQAVKLNPKKRTLKAKKAQNSRKKNY